MSKLGGILVMLVGFAIMCAGFLKQESGFEDPRGVLLSVSGLMFLIAGGSLYGRAVRQKAEGS